MSRGWAPWDLRPTVRVPLRKRIKRGVRSVVLVALLRLVSLIPLRPALRMGGWGGAIAYHLFSRTRGLALRHLAMAFPEKTEAERQAIARQMFVNLGLAAMEITAIRSYDNGLERYVELRDGELLREMKARGKGSSSSPAISGTGSSLHDGSRERASPTPPSPSAATTSG